MTSGLETEWDYSGRKERDGQKKKKGKANESEKKKRAKDEVNGQGEKGEGSPGPTRGDTIGITLDLQSKDQFQARPHTLPAVLDLCHPFQNPGSAPVTPLTSWKQYIKTFINKSELKDITAMPTLTSIDWVLDHDIIITRPRRATVPQRGRTTDQRIVLHVSEHHHNTWHKSRLF